MTNVKTICVLNPKSAWTPYWNKHTNIFNEFQASQQGIVEYETTETATRRFLHRIAFEISRVRCEVVFSTRTPRDYKSTHDDGFCAKSVMSKSHMTFVHPVTYKNIHEHRFPKFKNENTLIFLKFFVLILILFYWFNKKQKFSFKHSVEMLN